MDTYGSSKTKPVWLSAMLLSSPLGVIFGYGMTAIIESWRDSFFIQGMIVSFTSVLMLSVPEHYINIDVVTEAKKKETERRCKGEMVPELGGTG